MRLCMVKEIRASHYNNMNDYKNLYSTAAWKRIRRLHLQHEPLCIMCEILGKLTPATIVDHVMPHRGDHNLFYNGRLQSLCKQHHDRAKQIEERSGVIIGSDLKGEPIDPNHHWNKM